MSDEIIQIEEEEKEENQAIDYSAKAPKFESVVDYTTKLANFEGPLDLLLYLVNRAEIPIRDIFVSQVTEQFLDYLNRAEDMDIEKASEYLNIAATLLEIKSKSLLPVVEFDDFVDDFDPGEALIQQLEEYKIIKEASQKLKDIETTDRFYKAPDESANDVRIIYKDFNLDGLIKAFTDLMIKSDLQRRIKNEHKEIPKEVFTVADKVSYIRETLLERQTCSFYDLFHKNATRPEIITTFQALLELLKLQYLAVVQDEIYGDIMINLREDRSEEIGDLSEYN